jgi:signal transduction histidine kinase/phage shock protein PspC (stress-responsive transcriptional regulator)
MMAGPMSTAGRPPTAGLPSGLVRPRDERVVGGVCAGVARWLGVEPVVVRLAAGVLVLANGFGVLLYLVAWAVLPDEAEAPGVGPAAEGRHGHEGAAGRAGRQTGRTIELAVAVGCITLGVLLLIRWTLPFFPDRVVWPAAVAATGLAVVWTRVDERDRARWRELSARLPGNPIDALRGGVSVWVRLLFGSVLLIAGLGMFLGTNDAFRALGQMGAAVLATVVGGALLLGPWIVRLWRQLRAEARDRVRAEARADMAAHLHDSVLQTLALIQRHAEEPEQARSLARRQERALRAWLYDDRPPNGAAETLAAALDRMTDEVEADHRGVAVDVVTVGDRVVDDQVSALLGALREAVVNAAKHSGAAEVSVYVECDGDRIEAFVRDRGRGFDPVAASWARRRGITDSIVGRMGRHGGRAEVHSEPGEGTEVTFEMTCVPETT